MSRISPARDEAMADNGYVRVGTLAKLFRYQSSGGTTRWVQRTMEKKTYFTQNGSCWVQWKAARAHFNATEHPEQPGQADVLRLPMTASEALAEARRLAEEAAS